MMTARKKAPTKSWVPELITADGVHLSLNALRWRRIGAASLGAGSWKQTRLHYLRRLTLQLGVRGVVAKSTLSKGRPPEVCVEAELVSSWAGTEPSPTDSDGTDVISMSRLTLLYFQKDGADALETLAKLVGKLKWADLAHVIAA